MKIFRTLTLSLLGAAAFLVAALAVWLFLAVRSAAEGRASGGFQPDITVIILTICAFGAAVSTSTWGILADFRRRDRMKKPLPTLFLVFVAPFAITFFAFLVALVIFPVLRSEGESHDEAMWSYLFISALPIVVGTIVGNKLFDKDLSLKPEPSAISQPTETSLTSSAPKNTGGPERHDA